MKSRRKSNALLVELLIVILFFMLAATIVLQVFFAAHQQSEHARIVTEALNTAQSLADRLYLADDAEAMLTEAGFGHASGLYDWSRDYGAYVLSASFHTEETDAGLMRVQQVQAYVGEDVLFSLPCSRYEEGSL